KSIGSDQTSWPWAMVTDAAPENASGLSVAVSMVLSTAGAALHNATCAALMVTGPLPERLENWARIRPPPSETCAVGRTTGLPRGAGGWCRAAKGGGAAVQVLPKCGIWLPPAVPAKPPVPLAPLEPPAPAPVSPPAPVLASEPLRIGRLELLQWIEK